VTSWWVAVSSVEALRKLFPYASDAFLEANAHKIVGRSEPIDVSTSSDACTMARTLDGPKQLDMPSTLRKLIPHMSEADFQSFICGYATEHGWEWRHITHTTIAKRNGTQVGDRDARDLPDLFLWRGYRFIFREVKAATGRLTDGQLELLCAAQRAGIDARAWWPKDLDEILADLA
jgi:hypothetical protein